MHRAHVFAVFTFLIAATGFAVRFMPVTNHAVLLLAAGSPYLTLGAAMLVLPLMFTGRQWAAIPTLLLTVVAVLVGVPLFASPRPAVHSVAIRVLTTNVYQGAADPDALVAAADTSADVLLVQELTPELADELVQHGLEHDFPYRSVHARQWAAGVGIWSRYPIDDTNRIPAYQLGMVTATLKVPGASRDVTVATVHLAGPWPQAIDRWRSEIPLLPDTLNTLGRTAPGAVIVGGDLNATSDMRPFRRLLQGGFRSAVEQAGAGLINTYPANLPVPPLIGIDHILTLNSSAAAVQTVRIPGSDHLGLEATVYVPR